MVLKKKLTLKPVVQAPAKPEPKEKKSAGNKLPPDNYAPLMEEIVIPLNTEGSYQLRVNLKRGGELGLPYVDLRLYVVGEQYTGYTKKGVSFEVHSLLDVQDALEKVKAEIAAKKLL